MCECELRDSVNYLDHINGKKHAKKMGFSMRVERSSVGDVKDRFKSLKRKSASTQISKADEYGACTFLGYRFFSSNAVHTHTHIYIQTDTVVMASCSQQ